MQRRTGAMVALVVVAAWGMVERTEAGWLRRRGCCCAPATTPASAAGSKSAATAAAPATAPATEPAWRSLFDGKTLKNWKITEFGGQGEVRVEKGQIVLPQGSNMTGITWDGGALPKTNYEISLEAMRVEGSDFFCGLTFPVKDDPCSLILGGWGGGVVGISSINGQDAANNETTKFMEFKNGQWYRVRLRVTADKIQAWLDKDQVVDVVITDRTISIRPEVELSKPLGVATWSTTGALRDIKIRELDKK